MSRNQPCPCGSGKNIKMLFTKVSNSNQFSTHFSHGERVFVRPLEPSQNQMITCHY